MERYIIDGIEKIYRSIPSIIEATPIHSPTREQVEEDVSKDWRNEEW